MSKRESLKLEEFRIWETSEWDEEKVTRLLLRIAALLGSYEQWSGADMLEAIADELNQSGLLRFGVSDQSPEALTYWRTVAQSYGFEFDGEYVDLKKEWEIVKILDRVEELGASPEEFQAWQSDVAKGATSLGFVEWSQEETER